MCEHPSPWERFITGQDQNFVAWLSVHLAILFWILKTQGANTKAGSMNNSLQLLKEVILKIN